MTENFYIIGILWILDIAGQLGQSGESPPAPGRQGLLLGLALGMTVLLRQVFFLFIPILFLWLLWRCYRYQSGSEQADLKGKKIEVDRGLPSSGRGLTADLRSSPVIRVIATLLTATVVLLLAVAPWTIRNYQVFNRFVLLNTNAGFAFYWSNHPIHGQNYPADLPDWDAYVRLIPPELLSLDEAELDQVLLKRGLGFVRDDPRRYLMLSISRVDEYFMFWPSSDSSLISNVSRVFSFGLLWPLMAYGLLANVRRSFTSGMFILYLFIIFYTAIHLLSWALIRYRLPVDAVLILFSGAALVDIRMKLTPRQAKLQEIQLPKAEI